MYLLQITRIFSSHDLINCDSTAKECVTYSRNNLYAYRCQEMDVSHQTRGKWTQSYMKFIYWWFAFFHSFSVWKVFHFYIYHPIVKKIVISTTLIVLNPYAIIHAKEVFSVETFRWTCPFKVSSKVANTYYIIKKECKHITNIDITSFNIKLSNLTSK